MALFRISPSFQRFPACRGQVDDFLRVQAVVTPAGSTTAQVALGWLLRQAQQHPLIAGTSSLAHLEEEPRGEGAAMPVLSTQSDHRARAQPPC